MKYTLSNTGTGDTGATVSPVGLSLQIGNASTVISTAPATLASTVLYTNGAQLATFGGNGTGTFKLSGELDSYYNLGAVSAFSSLLGAGSYPVQVTVTYNYGTTIATHAATTPQGGGAVMLMYPTNATNLEFEATVGLNTNNWQTITNGNFILMVPTTLPQQFFRLHTKGSGQ